MRHAAKVAALLATLALEPSLRAEVSEPLPLGSTGLTLDSRLYLWDGAAWGAVAPNPATFSELGDGSYLAEDLPEATGTERYALEVFEDGSPLAVLATWVYGARPGSSLVAVPVVTIPGGANIFKQCQTSGMIQITVTSGLPPEIEDPGTTCTFSMAPPAGGAATIVDAACGIDNTVEDAVTGTWGAHLFHDLEAGDLPTVGLFEGEFTVTFPDASVLPVPLDNQKLTIRVNRSVTAPDCSAP